MCMGHQEFGVDCLDQGKQVTWSCSMWENRRTNWSAYILVQASYSRRRSSKFNTSAQEGSCGGVERVVWEARTCMDLITRGRGAFLHDFAHKAPFPKIVNLWKLYPARWTFEKRWDDLNKDTSYQSRPDHFHLVSKLSPFKSLGNKLTHSKFVKHRQLVSNFLNRGR